MKNIYKSLFVVNPISANGRTPKTWGNIERYLKQRGLKFDVRYTDMPREAITITREALQGDYQHILSVGGDGTLNEVVNGFFNNDGSKIKEDAYLSLIPMGTGGDFARMLKSSSHPQKIYEILAQGKEKKIDIVRSTFTGWSGQVESRYYLNVADVGVGSETVYHVNRNSKVFRGFLSFLVFGIYSILTYDNKLLNVKVDDRKVYVGKSSMVVISNGCYFGGGMKIAPYASLDDGLLDIIIVKDLSKLGLLKHVKGIYSGQHLNDPNIKFMNGKKTEILSDQKVYLEIDGETPGTGNLEFQIMPQEIKLLI
ncbi:MAG TPA: diacylglycerol kinase family protein [Syntrophomonadaceae bacterium]|nr:diacylglycerol kinase family protein [Syntrophomonadaceae bacterium]